MRRKSFDDISFGSVSALAMCCVCNFRAVKMFHLSAASRQDVPSFGGGSWMVLCVANLSEAAVLFSVY